MIKSIAIRRFVRLVASVGRPQLTTSIFLSTACWSCKKDTVPCSLFCQNVTCQAIQPVPLTKDLNLFSLFDIDERFEVDLKKLDHNFKEIQSKLHPDKFAMCSLEARHVSLVSSSTVNQAYQV